MKTKNIIIAVVAALAVIAAIITGCLISSKPNDPAVDPETTETDVKVNPVEDNETDETDNPVNPVVNPVVFDPDDPVKNGDVGEDEINEDKSVKVISVDNTSDVKPIDNTPVSTDKTVPEIKPKDEKPVFDVGGEILNDEIEEKKTEEKKNQEEKADKENPPVVIREESEKTEDDKGIIVDDQNTEDYGKGPAYVNPAQGGENPFAGDNGTKVEDHSVNDHVGGGERPGEGIHF